VRHRAHVAGGGDQHAGLDAFPVARLRVLTVGARGRLHTVILALVRGDIEVPADVR